MREESSMETATLGGGCFWCLEPVFEELNGVDRVVVGYGLHRLDRACRGHPGYL
jgi:peptide-methionine (S)-S-oxide reductase